MGSLSKMFTDPTLFNAWVQVLIVTAGIVISVLSFNHTRKKEAEAGKYAAEKEAEAGKYAAEKEARARGREVAKPFLELRQKLYTEAVRVAVILTNPSSYTPDQLEAAKKRFRELYVAELSMVEAPEVEAKMVKLAQEIDPELTHFTPAQSAAYELSHALRDSFVADYGL
jgi:hypothetical protein